MLDYWTSFARSGAPRASGGPDWAAFLPARAAMRFGAQPQMTKDFMPGMYELHEQAMCRRRAGGTQSWNWRAGSTAPVLPVPPPGC